MTALRSRSEAATRVQPRSIGWATWLPSVVIALIGFGTSVYLTVDHYTASTILACPRTSFVNCAKVTTSSWSAIGPVPVALLGAVFFASMALLTTPIAWRHAALDRVRLAGAVAGVIGALYFVWVELFRVDALCIWCTVAHAAAVALLVAVVWTTTGLRDGQ